MGFYKRMQENNRVVSKEAVFRLAMDNMSDTDKFLRSNDSEKMVQFNKEVEAWAERTTAKLKASASSLVRQNIRLSESIRSNLYYDSKYAREVNRVGFSFWREGVYIHYGAGKGQGGIHGSEWWSTKGLKKTLSSSLGKMGQGNRRRIEWFNPVIAAELQELADIVSNYSADMQIDASNIFID
ncbi:MAG: hypothetical protein BGN96_05135 [Bacteroidales bacterium 45-6]|nr:MAG: hypothetical protein BGN96_05135 [Bacteroidales bacterium 45-6]